MLRPSHFPETRPSLVGALRNSRIQNESWREFFQLYAPSVFRVAQKNGMGPHDADDVVQQVMVAVSAHIGRFAPEGARGRFRRWIRVITENKVHDVFRYRQRHGGIPCKEMGDAHSELPDLQQVWEEEWYAQDLQHCLKIVEQEISPKRFEAFRLYALSGVSAEETAMRLGMTKTHVYVTRNRVIQRVRELFDELRAAENES